MSAEMFGCQSPARPQRSNLPSTNWTQYAVLYAREGNQQLKVNVIGQIKPSTKAWYGPKISYSCNSNTDPFSSRLEARTRSAGPKTSCTSDFFCPTFRRARLVSDFRYGSVIPHPIIKGKRAMNNNFRTHQIMTLDQKDQGPFLSYFNSDVENNQLNDSGCEGEKIESGIEGCHKTVDALACSDCATSIRKDGFTDFLPTSDFDEVSGLAHSAF
jgi:hypothetical protein